MQQRAYSRKFCIRMEMHIDRPYHVQKGDIVFKFDFEKDFLEEKNDMKLWVFEIHREVPLECFCGQTNNELFGFFVSVGPAAERGHFGPWATCKTLLYYRDRCGAYDSTFRPIGKFSF